MKSINFVEFVTAVNAGSFSKAALLLGVSKSHISKKITQLEQNLGIQLLHRSTRKLALTEIGAIYHQRCKKILDEIYETEALLMDAKTVPKGTLNISLPATFGEQLFMPLLAEFMLQHQALKINATITTRVVDIIDEGLDMAIRLGNLPDSNLMARKLGATPWILSASPFYLKEYGTPKSTLDLQQHRCLAFAQFGLHASMNWKFSSAGKTQSITINPVLVSDNGAALHAAAKKGVGIVFLPEFFVANDLAEHKLVHILPECRHDTPISAIYPYSHYLSPKVRLCIDFLVAALCE